MNRLMMLALTGALAGVLGGCGGGGGGGGGGGPAASNLSRVGLNNLNSSSSEVLRDANFRATGDLSDIDQLPGLYASLSGDATRNMPQNVTATYEGSIAGAGVIGNNAVAYGGDVNMTANFGAGTVQGQVRNTEGILIDVNNPPRTPAELNAVLATEGPLDFGMNMNGTITGNTYSGTVRMTDAAGVESGTASRTRMTGVFAGDAAAETVGTVRYEGTGPASMGGGQTALIGVFGADKQTPPAPPPGP